MKEALKSSYKILTISLVKFEKQGFSRNLFSVHVDAHWSQLVVFEVKGVRSVTTVISFRTRIRKTRRFGM